MEVRHLAVSFFIWKGEAIDMPTHESNRQDSAHDVELDNAMKRHMHDGIAQHMLQPVFIIFIYSLVQVMRLGVADNHYLFMLVASVISFVCVNVYTRSIFHPREKELLAAPSMTIAYVIVYLFALYIFLYQGLWGLLDLQHGFSIWIIIKSAVALYLGTQLAKTASRISDEVKGAEYSHD